MTSVNSTERSRNFSDHVKASFRKQAIMKLFRARITRLDRGVVEISAENRPEFGQQDGYVHAGALLTLTDSAGGYATLSALPPGSRVLSVELKLNFLRPAFGTIIRGRARVRKLGGTISVCEIEAEMKQGRKWVTCAWGTQTVYCIRNMLSGTEYHGQSVHYQNHQHSASRSRQRTPSRTC